MAAKAPRFPGAKDMRILFAHVAYPMSTVFDEYRTGIKHAQAWSREETQELLQDADVLVVSGFWSDDLLDAAPDLRFIQSIGAGFDQFPLDELRRRGIRLASARGVNRNAVSDHAFGLILGLSRKIHDARDNQRKRFWRQMITDIPAREDELAGKTLGIVGLGHIGSRVARIGKAFDMRVTATKRDPSVYEGPADEVLPPDGLDRLLSEADYLVLNCPLTDETRGIIGTEQLEAMRPSAYLINVARGACVDEPALAEA